MGTDYDFYKVKLGADKQTPYLKSIVDIEYYLREKNEPLTIKETEQFNIIINFFKELKKQYEKPNNDIISLHQLLALVLEILKEYQLVLENKYQL